MNSILLLWLISPILASHLYNMIGVCQKDETCPSGYKGIVCSGSGLELNGCTESKYCSSEVVGPFQIKACDKDYADKSCSSGACYYH